MDILTIFLDPAALKGTHAQDLWLVFTLFFVSFHNRQGQGPEFF
jgi:hypothetical protein